MDILRVLTHSQAHPQSSWSLAGRLALVGFVLLAVLNPVKAWADGMAIQVKTGISTLSVSAGSAYKGDGGIGLEIRPQVNYELSSIRSAFGLFYEGHLGSNLGSFPVSRYGLAYYYYPTGLPLANETMDNGVSISQNHFSFFLTGQGAFASVSVTDISSPAHPLAFNGSTLSYLLGAGVEMPMSQTISLIGELLLEGTLAGDTSDASGALSSSGLSYSGMGGFIGVSVRP